MEHEKAVLMLVTALCEAYERKIRDQFVKLYSHALKEVPTNVINQVLPKLLKRNSAFMPRPGEVLAACVGDRPESFDPAAMAWKVLRKAIASVGGYYSVVFTDPAIAAAVEDMGGWTYLCELTQRDIEFKAKEFPQRYELARRMKLQAGKVLAGLQSRDAKTGKADVKVIGYVDGVVKIGNYAQPKEQKLLEAPKPVAIGCVADFAKRLEQKACETEKSELSATALPIKPQKREKDPNIAIAERELLKSTAIQKLKKSVFGE